MNKMFLTVALLLILNQSINANVVCPNTEVLTVGCAKVPGELCGVVAVCRSDLVCTDHTCRYREGFNATAGIDIRYLETPGFTSSYENNRDYYWSIIAPYGREVVFTIVEGDSESCCDYLKVSDGAVLLEHVSGRVSNKTFISTNGTINLHFHSDGSGVKTGYRSTYKIASCSRTLAVGRTPQTLSSPGYPGSYINSLDCVITLITNIGSQIEITFHDVQTEPCCDYVEITEGNATLGKLKGTPLTPTSYTSTLNQMNVRFFTDASVQRRGFTATYKQVTCGASVTATTTPQTFWSPNHPNDYPNNAHCFWNFHTTRGGQVQVTFTTVHTEDCCDFVEIFERGQRVGKLNGNIIGSRTFTSVGHSLSVYFKSDSSVSRSGFNATYMIAKCGGNMSATFNPQYFTSPNYPSLYTNNADCVWTIKPSIPAFLVELIVLELRTESCCDYVEVLDSSRTLGRLKGNARNRVFMSQSGELKIRFHSDQSVAFAGFRASYKLDTCGTNHTATPTPAPLTSPHYPNNYPNNLECEWNLMARESFQVELNVVELFTERCCDYVDIFDGSIKLARLKGNITARSYISTSGGLRVVFYSDGSVVMRGFNATFLQAPCQTNLLATTESQYFSSTNYPDNYPNNEDCSWIITTDPSQQIELNIIELETEQCCDYLKVYDGDSLVADLAGSKTNQQFTSTSGVLRLRFYSDGTGSAAGFNATYHKVVCGGDLQARETPQYISSPGYPATYPPNTMCVWDITAPPGFQVKITFNGGSTEECCDYIEIVSEGIKYGRLQGEVPYISYLSKLNTRQPSYLGQGQISVTFSSDRSVSGVGFNATYKTVACGGNMTATNIVQSFTSRNYPDNYPNNEDCDWYIHSSENEQVELMFNSFNTESCCDFVEVFDGETKLVQLRGSQLMQRFISTSHSLRVHFHTDGSVARRGFNATFKLASCGGELTATTTPQSLMSPNFPLSYPLNVRCMWAIHATPGFKVMFNIIGGRTQQCCDYIQIGDGNRTLARYRGVIQPGFITSQSNLLSVLFHSDSTSVYQGFNATYQQVTCGQHLTATNVVQSFTSRNYPDNYPNNEDCYWSIVAPYNQVVELTMSIVTEQCCDYVEIFDGIYSVLGKLQGRHTNATFVSTQQLMRIRFYSDRSVARKGFTARYISA